MVKAVKPAEEIAAQNMQIIYADVYEKNAHQIIDAAYETPHQNTLEAMKDRYDRVRRHIDMHKSPEEYVALLLERQKN